MLQVPAPQDHVHPGEAVPGRIRTEDPEVMRGSTADHLRALTVGHGLGPALDLTPGVVVVAGPGTGVTIERGSSGHTTIAAHTTSLVSRASIIRTIVAVVTISKTVIDSIIINTTIASATDAAVVLIIAVEDADVVATVAVDSSTVNRASATSGIGGTSGIDVPHLAIGTAIVATLPIR